MILVEQDLFKETYVVVTSTSCVFFWPIMKLTFVFIARVAAVCTAWSFIGNEYVTPSIGSQFCYKKADHDVYN